MNKKLTSLALSMAFTSSFAGTMGPAQSSMPFEGLYLGARGG